LASLRQGLRQFREYVNTLMIQDMLADPEWADVLTDEDKRALTLLFWMHIQPYLDEFPSAGPAQLHMHLIETSSDTYRSLRRTVRSGQCSDHRVRSAAVNDHRERRAPSGRKRTQVPVVPSASTGSRPVTGTPYS
jgi:hypothetical protein